jgi:hypothetical protein
MNADAIKDYLRREPFEPFVIRMSNGEVHDIRHPECAFVMKSKMIVYYPDDDRSVTCSLVHINSIETLQAS